MTFPSARVTEEYQKIEVLRKGIKDLGASVGMRVVTGGLMSLRPTALTYINAV